MIDFLFFFKLKTMDSLLKFIDKKYSGDYLAFFLLLDIVLLFDIFLLRNHNFSLIVNKVIIWKEISYHIFFIWILAFLILNFFILRGIRIYILPILRYSLFSRFSSDNFTIDRSYYTYEELLKKAIFENNSTMMSFIEEYKKGIEKSRSLKCLLLSFCILITYESLSIDPNKPKSLIGYIHENHPVILACIFLLAAFFVISFFFYDKTLNDPTSLHEPIKSKKQ